MIKRLESAGLGFFVKTTKTQQKLGMHYVIIIMTAALSYICYNFKEKFLSVS